MLSRVLNPLLQNHILARVVDFFIAGHILYMYMHAGMCKDMASHDLWVSHFVLANWTQF